MRSAFTALLTGVLAGCAAHPINEHQPYPEAFPSLAVTAAEGNGCPDISGVFDSQPFQSVPVDSARLQPLHHLLAEVYVLGRGTSVWTQKQARQVEAELEPLESLTAEAVRLVLETERLKVSYVARDGTTTTFEFAHGGFTTPGPRYACHQYEEGPGLRFWPLLDNQSWMVQLPVGMAGGSDTVLVLFRAVDGTLVARLQAESGFTVLLIPYIKTDSAWLRFKPRPELNR